MDETHKTSTDAKPATRKRWFRFSILTIILLTTIIGLITSQIAMTRDRVRLEAELSNIRKANQIIEVRDPNKVYVLPMDIPLGQVCQWRVYIPEGSTCLVRYEVRELFQPSSSKTISECTTLTGGNFYTISQTFDFREPHSQKLPSGRTVLQGSDAVLFRITQDEQIKHGIHRLPITAFQRPLPWNCSKWLSIPAHRKYRVLKSTDEGQDRAISINTEAMPQGISQSFDLDDEIVLIRHEAYDSTHSPPAKLDDRLPQDLFRLWIEKAPQTP